MDILQAVEKKLWKSCVSHVVDKVEPKLWDMDHMMDDVMESFIVDLRGEIAFH